MSSTYSSSLRVELIGSGDQAGTWGTTTDNNFAYIFDTAIAGYQTVSITSASQALTYVNGPTASTSLNQSVYAMLRLTTTTVAAFSVYAPPVSKTYIIYNNSGYTATVYNSTVIGNTTAAGLGIAIANGDKVLIWSDGTNFYEIKAASLTGTLDVPHGGTGATSFTSGALLKGAGTGAVTVASAADIVGQIGATAVQNATNAVDATDAVNAENLITASFSVLESGGKLYFKYGATNIASLDSSGNFVSLANVTAYGTP
jgi:hypothetical protein